jgi:hypothetical protein
MSNCFRQEFGTDEFGIARWRATLPSIGGFAAEATCGSKNMRAHELRDVLRRQPFEPIRVCLTTGQTYEILHPEFAALTATSLFVGSPSAADELPVRMVQCDLRHVVAVEPVAAD